MKEIMTPIARIIIIYFWVLIKVCSPLDFSKFSSKTAYSWSQPNAESREDEWYEFNHNKGTSCWAVHSSAVIRHGARYPGLDDILDLIEMHKRLVNVVKPTVNPGLFNWSNRFPVNNDRNLHQLGKNEQERLGKRIGKRLYSLFNDEEVDNIQFIVSSKQRAKDSASAFYKGFTRFTQLKLGEDHEEDFEPEEDDEIMRFFNLCEKYEQSVKKNITAYQVFQSFLMGHKMDSVKKKFEEKLMIQEDILTPDDVRLIYLACAYELAAFGSSPWCSVLDDESVDVLDYLGDIRQFIQNGYKYEITREQSCPLLSDIFLGFDKVIKDRRQRYADDDYINLSQFAFGHAETLGPLYALMGLFYDSTPPEADNYERSGQRLWDSSRILPFSANAVFVLYECVQRARGPEEPPKVPEYFLKMFVNERPQRIPGCDDLQCSYDKVRDHYSPYVDGCDFDKVCEIHPPPDEL